MKLQRVLLRAMLAVTFCCGAAWAQDTGSITNGTHGGGNISFTRTNSVAT